MTRRAVPLTEAPVPIRREYRKVKPSGHSVRAVKEVAVGIARPLGTGVSIGGT